MIQGVPAEVCDYCGETFLDAAVAHALDDLLAGAMSGPSDVAFVRYATS